VKSGASRGLVASCLTNIWYSVSHVRQSYGRARTKGFLSSLRLFGLTCLTWLTCQARLYQALCGLSTDNVRDHDA
jgi:hypothetical protein